MMSTDWARIAEHVGNRSGDQCSKRWREVLDPMINKSSWSSEEDKLLVELFEKHGSCWQHISTFFNNRRALQCRNRCCKLLRLHTPNRSKNSLRAKSSPTDPFAHYSPDLGGLLTSPISCITPTKADQTNMQPQMNRSCVNSLPKSDVLQAGVFDNNYMVQSSDIQTLNFINAWNKVQGFSSVERKNPPAALNLNMDMSMAPLPSPAESIYSPFLDTGMSLQTSNSTSPTTPAVQNNYAGQRLSLRNPAMMQPNVQDLCSSSGSTGNVTSLLTDNFPSMLNLNTPSTMNEFKLPQEANSTPLFSPPYLSPLVPVHLDQQDTTKSMPAPSGLGSNWQQLTNSHGFNQPLHQSTLHYISTVP